MNIIKDVKTVELTVNKEELIFKDYIIVALVSEKLKQKEDSDNLEYKALRNRFYNSLHSDKYNVVTKSGLKCLSVRKPMKASKASLEIIFKEV